MMVNGWHRIGLVVALGWAMAVVSCAAFEHHASRLETGDGFFTCWEPFDASPSAPAGLESCGVLARLEITPGAFQSIMPGVRYLNVLRLFAVLGGPIILLGLVIAAVSWVIAGYRLTASRERAPEVRPYPATPSANLLGLPAHHDARAWLGALPRRWARNAALAGGATALFRIQFLLAASDTATANFLILGVVAISMGSAAGAYLCGVWARSSLKAPFSSSPPSALAHISPNWLTGAMILAALLLASDVLVGWRSTTPLFANGISPRDMGYLVGFFGTWLLLGYSTALISQRGVRKAIEADRRRPSEQRVPFVGRDAAPLDRGYFPR